jgi:hypothetical protein
MICDWISLMDFASKYELVLAMRQKGTHISSKPCCYGFHYTYRKDFMGSRDTFVYEHVVVPLEIELYSGFKVRVSGL